MTKMLDLKYRPITSISEVTDSKGNVLYIEVDGYFFKNISLEETKELEKSND